VNLLYPCASELVPRANVCRWFAAVEFARCHEAQLTVHDVALHISQLASHRRCKSRREKTREEEEKSLHTFASMIAHVSCVLRR
jgi:hypothetical protein